MDEGTANPRSSYRVQEQRTERLTKPPSRSRWCPERMTSTYFWADYGTGAYATADLRQIKIAMTSGSTPATYAPGSERDAFACVLPDVQWNGGNGVSATLKRPLAKLTMRNKEAFNTGDKAVSVTYRNVPTRYDVLTEKTLPGPPDRNGRIPEYDRKLGNSRRRLPLRSLQRGTVRRPLDYGGRRNQGYRRAAAAAELRDQRNGHVRITDNRMINYPRQENP